MKTTIYLTCALCPARVSETYDNAEAESDERAHLHVQRRAIAASFRRIPEALPYRRWDAWLCTDCTRDVRKVLDGEKPDGDDAEPAECPSCRGYGFFSEYGKPTIDKRGARKCLDCTGTGRAVGT